VISTSGASGARGLSALAELHERLEVTSGTIAKTEAVARALREATASDAAWMLFFLSGGRLKRVIGPARLAEHARAALAIEPWLFEECAAAVGDLSETIALLFEHGPGGGEFVDGSRAEDGDRDRDGDGDGDEDRDEDRGEDRHEVGDRDHFESLASWVEALRVLPTLDEETRAARVIGWWRALPFVERLVLTKLLTGELRSGVSRTLVVRAVELVSGVAREVIEHRLTGTFEPSEASWRALVDPSTDALADASRPYPFALASPLDLVPAELGPIDAWIAENKWDGIRAQVVRRSGTTWIWSRGEELVTDRFPDLVRELDALPDGTVLDAELLAWLDGSDAPLPFAELQKRIGRTKLGPKILREVPARLVAYDLLEAQGEDLRESPLVERRARLAELVQTLGSSRVALSPRVEVEASDGVDGWSMLAAHRESSRARGVEGLMLKRADSPYRGGRKRGDWWKWKVDPFTIDAVLIYAQAGHGKRAGLFTDYTFAVWHEGALVSVAKAYTGLDDAEIRELDAWIRRHTVERFGPVRSVEPVHVFELAFEDVRASTRHKSGVAVRFPRIVRWRRDKPAAEADTLAVLQKLARA
jgi:DNA ligase-1